MASVYILYTSSADIYYVGSTQELSKRLEYHFNQEFNNSFTTKYQDWELFFAFEVPDNTTARKIEAHIKRMKSKKYLQNLKRYPEMSIKLITQYSVDMQSR